MTDEEVLQAFREGELTRLSKENRETELWKLYLMTSPRVLELYTEYDKPRLEIIKNYTAAEPVWLDISEHEYDMTRYFVQHLRSEYKDWKKEHEEESKRKPRKQFAFTLTTNKTAEEIQQDMCYSCHKLYLQQTVPIRQGEAYLEYTKEGRPHIHGWYETEDGGRVFAKVFQRAWKYWKEQRGQKAFAGGFHELMKSNRYKGYASAEGRVIIIKKINEELVYNAPGEEQTNAQASSEECDIGP